MSNRQSIDDMESWFERMNREFRDATRRWGEATEQLGTGRASPDIDVIDRENDYVVAVDLPGFASDEVEVRLADDTLLIEAELEETDETEDGSYLRRERRQRSVSRRVTLPAAVEADEVDASMRRGVLRVVLPKAESVERGTEIQVT